VLAYDTGALVAGEADNRRMWALHQRTLARGILPIVPVGVLAEAWRDGSRQALLGWLLAGCLVEPLDEQRALAVGVLAGLAQHSDVVDVSVVECAIRHRAAVVTSNHTQIENVARAAGVALPIAQV
jgi:predicted nucleic acid-binding protein